MTAEILREDARERSLRAGIGLYGQVLIGFCLFLAEYAGTPAWLSILGAFPFLWLCLFLASRARPMGPVARLTAAAVFWLDALAAYLTLCALCMALLPDHSPWLLSILLAAFAAGTGRETGGTVSVLSRPAALVIFLPLVYCAAAALPEGSLGRLFPLLGEGPERIALGAAWACGCVSSACFPWLHEKDGLRRPPRLPVGAALLLGGLTGLFFAYLLPYPMLSRPALFARRLMLAEQFSSSAAIWPLLTAVLLFLLLYALVSSLRAGAGCVAAVRGRGKAAPGIEALMLLPMLPMGAAQSRIAQEVLLILLPARALLTLLLLLFLQRKKAPGKGAAPHA